MDKASAKAIEAASIRADAANSINLPDAISEFIVIWLAKSKSSFLYGFAILPSK